MNKWGDPRMEDLGNEPYETNTPSDPEQNDDHRRRNAGIAVLAGLGLISVAVLGARIASSGEEPVDQAAATAIAGASPTPTGGNSEIPTHKAAPLTPETPSATSIPHLPVIKPSQSTKPHATSIAPTKPVVAPTQTPKPTPSPAETTKAPATPETFTPGGALLIPFITDKPAERTGKSEKERIALFEIPVQDWPLDNQARKKEAMRAYKEYVSRLVAWRSYGNTTPWEKLYNDPNPIYEPNNWPPYIADESKSIFEKALSGDLAKGSDGKATRRFYDEMKAVVAGDAEAYYHSAGVFHDEKEGASYNTGDAMWSTNGPYRSSYAIVFNHPEAVVVGADKNGNPEYRIDSTLVDYNNAPKDPRVIQRTAATIDERAKIADDKGTGTYETFLQIGQGVDGKKVWLFRQR